MTCIEVQQNLVAHINGELNRNEVIKIHQHLSTCISCVTEEIELRKMIRLMDKYQFEILPDSFERELQRKLATLEKPSKMHDHDLRRIVFAVAATILLVIGIQFSAYHLYWTIHQPNQFADFPTIQSVFTTVENASSPQTSWKQRYLEQYLNFQQRRNHK